MRKRYLLIAVAWLMYLLAWTIPVYQYGVVLPKALPGWKALGVSFSPLLDYLLGKRIEASLKPALLWAISGATNLSMIGSVWAVKARGRRVLNVLFWMSVGAAIINAHWYVWGGSELRIGYFLWWLSFLVLAGGIHIVLKAEGDEPGDLQRPVSAD